MSTIVAIVSDLHINSAVGLCKPGIELDDGGTYRASTTQRWLYRQWIDYWDKISKEDADRKVAILNGDVGEVDGKNRTDQIITTNKAAIFRIVLDTLEPMFDAVDDVIVVRGTAAHSGKGAWLEEMLAHDIDAIPPEKGKAPYSHWHLVREIDGVKFDITHHTSMGRLPHTEKNAANKVAAIGMWRYVIDKGVKPPDIFVRSHNHRYADSGNNYKSFAVCTPCFTTATEYVYRIGQENDLADIGGLVFYCDKGEWGYKQIRYEYPKGELRWKKI